MDEEKTVRRRKLLFLDIDGVMNARADELAERMIAEYGPRHVMPTHVTAVIENPCEPHISALNAIHDRVPGLEVVISSTWRNEMIPVAWQRFFATLGIRVRVVGCTPHFGGYRGAEIMSYLIRERGHELYRGERVGIGIDGFVVLDDDYDPCWDWIARRWVRIDGQEGLTERYVDEVVRVLNSEFSWPFLEEYGLG